MRLDQRPFFIGGVGCRLCLALRELLTFSWSTDPARFNKLMDNGGCYPAAGGIGFVQLDHRMADPATGQEMAGLPALWFRNGDMRVEGSNEPEPRIVAPAPPSN
jgi:hypothetical protein